MSRVEALERFRRDTQQHAMTIERDDGLYRHLRFRRPDTFAYGYDVLTWPGYLAIVGDMGASVFTRLPDMLEFFREKPEQHERANGLYINPSYWAEKLAANDGDPKEFSSDQLHAYVKRRFDEYLQEHREEGGPDPDWAVDLWADLEIEVLDAADVGLAINAMDHFEPDDERYETFRFVDSFESAASLEVYTFHFLWRLYAVAAAVLAYDEAKSQAVPA